MQALINAEAKGELKSGKIALVISNKAGAYALERAKKAGIRAETVLKKSLARRRLSSRKLSAF